MYQVQIYTIVDEWYDVFKINYNSFGDAVDALDEYLLELDGDGVEYNRAEYRIHFVEKQSARAWTLSVQDDFGNWNEIDVADHRVSDIINEYILDLEESF